MKETEIIQSAAGFQRYHPELVLGIEDDTALFQPEAGYTYAWAVDTLVEGTHFLREMPADAVGWKSLAVNLSDLVAMNAQPLACLLSLALPQDLPTEWIESFFAGFRRCCDRYQVDLAGGDTVRQTQGINVSVSILGKSKSPYRRRGAQAGDLLVVSGSQHGAAARGLIDFQQKNPSSSWIKHQLYPIPRFDILPTLERFSRVHTLDTSDSLLKSARLLAEINGLGCRLYRHTIPTSFSWNAQPEQFQRYALQGGEDFEIMAAIPAKEQHSLDLQQFTVIGQLVSEQKYTLHQSHQVLDFSEIGEGFEHF